MRTQLDTQNWVRTHLARQWEVLAALPTIVVEDTHSGRVEDAQMTILRLLCYALMESLTS